MWLKSISIKKEILGNVLFKRLQYQKKNSKKGNKI